MRARDLLLVIVTIGGMGIGLLLPGPLLELTGLTPFLLMALLFLSFLRLDFASLLKPAPRVLAEAAIWSLVKLLLLPACLWALAKWIWPEWALAVLVLSAVSTGVTCPFYASLLGADLTRIMLMVVLTSLALPLSLPALIRLLEGTETSVPYLDMFWLLAMLLFVPAALMGLARRYWPGLMALLGKAGYPMSMGLMLAISAVVFAPLADHFRRDAGNLLAAVTLSFILNGVYMAVGRFLPRLAPALLTPLTGMAALVYINNVLGVVFASRFLDLNSVLLCGCYLFPIYTALLPLRWLTRRLPGAAR